VKRALGRDSIVVVDGLNYIKGYRYQLWCYAKEVGTGMCVVHVGTPKDVCRGGLGRRLKRRKKDGGIEGTDGREGNGDGEGKREGVENGREEREERTGEVGKNETEMEYAAEDNEEPYDPEVFENLIYRYEEPNGMNRWDSPLFTVLWDDKEPPVDAIWDALVGKEGKGKVVKSHQATVLVSEGP